MGWRQSEQQAMDWSGQRMRLVLTVLLLGWDVAARLEGRPEDAGVG